MSSYLLNRLQVALRKADPHAPVFEVFERADGEWQWRERTAGRITSDSSQPQLKSDAKRSAYAHAVRVPGSTVRVLGPLPPLNS